jgi:hypothetical protein
MIIHRLSKSQWIWAQLNKSLRTMNIVQRGILALTLPKYELTPSDTTPRIAGSIK